MAKITLNDLQSMNDLTELNDNFTQIEDEFQSRVLYRDNPTGEPNQMEQDLDMNSYRILNLLSLRITLRQQGCLMSRTPLQAVMLILLRTTTRMYKLH